MGGRTKLADGGRRANNNNNNNNNNNSNTDPGECPDRLLAFRLLSSSSSSSSSASLRRVVVVCLFVCVLFNCFSPQHESSTHVQKLARKGGESRARRWQHRVQRGEKGNRTGHQVTRVPRGGLKLEQLLFFCFVDMVCKLVILCALCIVWCLLLLVSI